MDLSPLELFKKQRQAWEVMDALLLRTPDARQRAALLAEMLQFLWPGEALSACVLRGGGEVVASALDESGAARPEWAALIRDELSWRWTAPEGSAPRTPLLQACGLTGLAPAMTDVRVRDKVYGALLLAVPEDDGSAEAVRALLAACGQHLALSLAVEGLERERAAAAEESSAVRRMAEVGEVTGPVAHEWNNFLNALLLQLSVLQIQLPAAAQQGLADLRRQALLAAELIRQMQLYRRRQRPSESRADLNRAVREAAEGLGGEGGGPGTAVRVALPSATQGGGEAVAVPVRLDLAPEGASAPGPAADLARLCAFLIRNAAAAAAGTRGAVVVLTAHEGRKVALRVEDTGPAVPADVAPHLFEPSAAGREGTSSLELAACKTLARRLNGALRAESPPEGGAAFIVEWDDPE